ncbi:MAG: hypothetical protein AB8D78_12325 [Akkermansiaceae bacterium]
MLSKIRLAHDGWLGERWAGYSDGAEALGARRGRSCPKYLQVFGVFLHLLSDPERSSGALDDLYVKEAGMAVPAVREIMGRGR